jgi:hypothetical protein
LEAGTQPPAPKQIILNRAISTILQAVLARQPKSTPAQRLLKKNLNFRRWMNNSRWISPEWKLKPIEGLSFPRKGDPFSTSPMKHGGA